MKKIIIGIFMFFITSGTAYSGGIDIFLNNLNIQARADLGGFCARVSTQFGVPLPKVQAAVNIADRPADAFMFFQLAEMSQRPYEEVVRVYEKQKGQGWGAMAKSLGIKPGSPEFHALKNGDLALTGNRAIAGDSSRNIKNKGKGRGKGKKDRD